MDRREFIFLSGGAAATWPIAARAQQGGQVRRIGFLRNATEDGSRSIVDGLRKGLSEAGFVEGRNLVIDYAWSDGQSERLPTLAADLVRRGVAVVVSSAFTPTITAKAATATIPVVFVVAADPVASGVVASISRPGGNMTGVYYLSSELGGKRLGLIHEILPSATNLAVLTLPTTFGGPGGLLSRDVEAAGRAAGIRIEVFNASTKAMIDDVFAALTARRVDALLVGTGPLFTTNREQIVTLAARHKVPTIYSVREFADAGGLMSYGSNLSDAYRLAGSYVGRILKGDKPADLPVILPTTFEMIINLKTAKVLGLTIPPGVLAIADEVIE